MKAKQTAVATKEILFDNAELQTVYETLSGLNKNYETLVDKLHSASQKISKIHIRKKINKKENNGIQ